MTGGLWNYYRDEIDNISGNASEGKSFKYKPRRCIQKMHIVHRNQQYQL